MTHRSDQRPSRRDLLRTLGAAPLAASALQAAPTARAQTSSSQARMHVDAGGSGGRCSGELGRPREQPVVDSGDPSRGRRFDGVQMRRHREAAQAALLSADRLERGPGAAVGQHLRGERQAAAGGRCTAHFEDVRRQPQRSLPQVGRGLGRPL